MPTATGVLDRCAAMVHDRQASAPASLAGAAMHNVPARNRLIDDNYREDGLWGWSTSSPVRQARVVHCQVYPGQPC